MYFVSHFAGRLLSVALLALAGLVPFFSRGQTASSSSTSFAQYRRPYDTSMLGIGEGPMLLPYNQIIDPAGSVLRFGSKERENHSLDAVLLPGRDVLAVEDRYGVTFIRVPENKLIGSLGYGKGPYKDCMSTYSGIKTYTDVDGQIHVLWSAAASPGHGSYLSEGNRSFLMDAIWDGHNGRIVSALSFSALSPSPLALPNDIAVQREGADVYVYVVLNGNSRLVKIRWKDQSTMWDAATGMAPYGIALAAGKVYVSNWAGPVPTDTVGRETAGIPYGSVYVDPRTGATALGTVSVFDEKTGRAMGEVRAGLHPNALLASRDGKFVYVANGNSDDVSVIGTAADRVIDSIDVRLLNDGDSFIGDTPDGLALDSTGNILYVANGMDNAVAVVQLGKRLSATGKGKTTMLGFIPTQAYPAGMVLDGSWLYVANLEGEGAWVPSTDEKGKSYNAHKQEATFSVIHLPDAPTLESYTQRVKANNFVFRESLSRLKPRLNIPAVPVPERIGEPSVFKHVIYIIKENRTYDQV
ncbi:MAG TPA: phosphoesterase, partial [Puia sp.]|nr:phosphoesterase [Puia sp.]